MEYILTAEKLKKQYGSATVLNDFSMHIPKGAIYGFVGENGAGKTTLIRILCGLQEPTSGSYTLYGIRHTSKDIRKAQKRMGAVVESPAIYHDLTAKDNLKMQYQLLGMPSYDGLEELLSLVGLQHTARKKVKHFSLGMRQRLGIAIALVGNPDFLILDEPGNGLDPQGTIEMRELILKLNRERQITVLISSHNLDELSRIATHYGFISGGHMIQEITAEELEECCQSCIILDVTNINTLARILDSLKLAYKVVSKTTAKIYGDVPLSELAQLLSKENCQILSLHEKSENLESYYINHIKNVGKDKHTVITNTKSARMAGGKHHE